LGTCRHHSPIARPPTRSRRSPRGCQVCRPRSHPPPLSPRVPPPPRSRLLVLGRSRRRCLTARPLNSRSSSPQARQVCHPRLHPRSPPKRLLLPWGKSPPAGRFRRLCLRAHLQSCCCCSLQLSLVYHPR